MKLLSILSIVISTQFALATVDIQGQATIVVESYHDDGFFLRTVPTDYCVGIGSYALAIAITQPVTIKSNYGCGGDAFNTQINAASCAVVSALETQSHKHIAVKRDISKCGELANNPRFVKALDDAIYNTFNANGYQVVSIIEKRTQ